MKFYKNPNGSWTLGSDTFSTGDFYRTDNEDGTVNLMCKFNQSIYYRNMSKTAFKDANGVNYASNEEFEAAAGNFFVDASVFMTEAIINKIYPVGHILTTEKEDNPYTYLNVGTWVAYGAGRVLVGLDASQPEFNTLGKTGGAKTHKLTVDEMPSHNHNTGIRAASDTNNDINNLLCSGGGSNYQGGDQAHNNLQPYITVYMWKRTE